MSKLNKLRKWLTLEQTVNRISKELGEPVTVADLYQFCLDGHLKLSAYFVNNAKVKVVTLIKKEDIKYKQKYIRVTKGTPKPIPVEAANIDPKDVQYCNIPINAQYPISKDYWLQKIEPKLHTINGLWDLTMIGAERLDIEHQYQQETSGIEVNTQSQCGVYLQQGSLICQLHISFESDPPLDSGSQSDDVISDEERRDLKIDESNIDSVLKKMRPRPLNREQSNPAERLGEQEHVLVVRGSEITRFIQSLEEKPQEDKPLHGKERATLHILFASALKMAKIDLDEKGIVKRIERAAESNNTPISNQNIRNTLLDVRATVE